MYLRSITMKGFKSFPERARLEFSPGVSVIVGPNGSGKSNITDAVLWALGEQSPGAIRGASMQDVISAGGKGVGQRRAAEVEVVIDNSEGRAATEFSEIAVQRSLDRSGDGVYRLNGARCRLVDVVEVLSDTNLGREMHSVISQGRVESIVHSKPRERRLLVEEAAGLGKHRKRRRRAELKLRAAARQPRPGARPGARGARPAAAAEAPGPGRRAGGADRARGAGAARPARLRGAALRRRPRRRGREGGGEGARDARPGSRSAWPRSSERRRAAEERFAARDRERTQAWGLLTKLRGEQERVAVRAASLAGRESRARAASLEALRAELGPLTLDVGAAGGAPAERARKLEEELGEIDAGLATAADGPRPGPLRRRRRVGPRVRARRGPRRRRARLAPRPPGRGAAGRAPPRGAAQAGGRRRGAARGRARRRRGDRGSRAPRSAPGSSGPRARWSAARATATRSPRRCAPARSASTSCRPR